MGNINEIDDKDTEYYNRISSGIIDYFHMLSCNNYNLYSLTVTYNMHNNCINNIQFVNRIFYLLYIWILKKTISQRNFHKKELRYKQPICFVYPDVTGKSRNRITHTKENLHFLSSIHHHAMIAVHDEANEKFRNIIDFNKRETTDKGRELYQLKYNNAKIRSCRLGIIDNNIKDIERWIIYSSGFCIFSKNDKIRDSIIYLPKSLNE